MSEWYIKAFNEYYPILYPHRDDTSADHEIQQLIRFFDLKGNEQVLDVCCGAARHLSALLDRGFNAWGIDLSKPLLQNAANRRNLANRIINADMRWLPFKSCFHVVINLFTSFGYFLEDNQNRAALHEMASVLQPGGLLLIDHINRSSVEKDLVRKSYDKRGDWELVQKRRIEHNRVIKEITMTSHDGFTTGFTENVRLFYPDEIRGLFQSAGLKDIYLFGSFAGDTLHENATRMIVTGRK